MKHHELASHKSVLAKMMVERFCTAAILDGRTMKIICIRKNICSHGKKNLLFLPSNMAAVQNLY